MQGHFEIYSLRNGIFRGVQEVFSTADALFFCQNTLKTGNNAVEISQAFHDIARFERFIDLNLFKCAFNNAMSFKTRKLDALQLYSMVLIFCQQLWQKEMKVAGEGWLTSPGFVWLLALIDSPVT